MLADDEPIPQVETLSRSGKQGAGVPFKGVALVRIPLRSPVEEGRAATGNSDIEILRRRIVNYLREVEVDLYVMACRVGRLQVALHVVVEEELFGVGLEK
jgi:hypothetical protein